MHTLDPQALPQHVDRAARGHGGVESNVFGVMQIAERQAINPQQPQAALDAPPHLRSCEIAGMQIAVGLGCQHEATR